MNYVCNIVHFFLFIRNCTAECLAQFRLNLLNALVSIHAPFKTLSIWRNKHKLNDEASGWNETNFEQHTNNIRCCLKKGTECVCVPSLRHNFLAVWWIADFLYALNRLYRQSFCVIHTCTIYIQNVYTKRIERMWNSVICV